MGMAKKAAHLMSAKSKGRGQQHTLLGHTIMTNPGTPEMCFTNLLHISQTNEVDHINQHKSMPCQVDSQTYLKLLHLTPARANSKVVIPPVT